MSTFETGKVTSTHVLTPNPCLSLNLLAVREVRAAHSEDERGTFGLAVTKPFLRP
ncbi:hypothetical protein L218DRAFT_963877 [Marasmius fiardii PR-910]|nr:hypothetical protein L218DRAFT_963877 [Marasmius fiardii PR-910]